ncbi:transposase [Micromonospora sp. NPDC005299]|uniref:transposase n=1 Tax=Micromonospora sp. NPDC005299 TaxID=3364231 RepID=UPI0036B1A3D7
MPEAVEATWPRTTVQTCVAHLLRNSFWYAARQDWDKIAKALKPVYAAATEDAATDRFMELADAWGEKPLMSVPGGGGGASKTILSSIHCRNQAH